MNDESKVNEDYRRVLATANKLETIQGNLESVIDFFLAPIVKLYTKLGNDCLKLLFECEFKLDHFRRAEELVWRRIYHDLYRFQKTKRQLVRKQEECLIEQHFMSGIGFYSSLIIRLRAHFKIYSIPGVMKPLNLTIVPLDNIFDNSKLNCQNGLERTDDTSMSLTDEEDDKQSKARDWARQAIYRSLVYMGDLARYLLEICQYDYRNLAFEFYRSAARNQPDYGLPFNQLATLAGGLNHNLDAVCDYMRCCLKPKPFDGAEGNMRKIFDLNRKFHQELKIMGYITKISDVYSSKDPSSAAESMVRAVIVSFISLASEIWIAVSGKSENPSFENIINEAKAFFELLREALELEPIVPLSSVPRQEFRPISGGSSNPIRPKYLSPTIMYEFCNISIMLIAKSQKLQAPIISHDVTGSSMKDPIKTLALNLLHSSSVKCQKMIMGKVQELRIIRQEYLGGDPSRNASNLVKLAFETGLDDSEMLGGSQKWSNDNLVAPADPTHRRALSRMRQKKAATNYSVGGNIQTRPWAMHAEDSDMSELEETALSTIDALDISSDMSEEAANDLINLDSSSDDGIKNIDRHKLAKPRVLRPTRSQNYELERSINIMGSSSSLPVPDLLTGEPGERVNVKVSSQSPLESFSEPEAREKSPTEAHIKRASQQSTGNLSGFESALAFVYAQTYLPTIKIYCDWLLANGSIIGDNMDAFLGFCGELKTMVASLHDLKKMADIRVINDSDNSLNSIQDFTGDESPIYRHIFDGPQWAQKYPLSCDFPLLSLEPLKRVHEINIDFSHPRDLTDSESGFVTIECVTAFSHALIAYLENKSF